MVFDYWRFDSNLVNAIKYSNDYKKAPEKTREYSLALNIVKIAIPFFGGITEKSVEKAIGMLEDNSMDVLKFKASLKKIQVSF